MVKRYLFLPMVLLCVLFLTPCFALEMMFNAGMWPNSWPKEMEPYRGSAKTQEVASGTQENIYEIPIKSQDEFEKIWPYILQLTTKGSLVILENPSEYFTTCIRILAPSNGVVILPDGTRLEATPPWPDYIKSPSGELPEYVAAKYGKWIPWISLIDGVRNRARVDIILVTDGKVIDPNHISLPPNMSIVDKRLANTRAEEPKEIANKDGVHLVWQHIDERVGYLAYHVQSSESGLLELYWTCNGLRDDSKQAKQFSPSATYIVNTVPNGPVEDTANVIVEKLPLSDTQMAIMATIDWTNWRKGGTRETYAGEGSMTALTSEPRKKVYINFQKVLKPDNSFSKLPADQPFKLLTFTLETDEQKPEIWELYGNWLSQDKLIKEFRETKSFRSLSWLLANAVRNDMKREDITELLGPGTNPDEKLDKTFRKVCEKQNLSLQKDDVFVVYDARWVGEFLQFRNGVLINHKPEEYANPPISYMISVPKK